MLRLYGLFHKVTVNGVLDIGRGALDSLGVDLGPKGMVGAERSPQIESGVDQGIEVVMHTVCSVCMKMRVWSWGSQACI